MRAWVGFATWLPVLVVSTGSCSANSGGNVVLPPSATCSTGPVTDTQANTVDAVGENLDSTCGAVIGDLQWKMGATGSPCAQPIDCSPVCCPCESGSFHVLATFCDHGTCAAPEAVCCMVLGTPLKACGP